MSKHKKYIFIILALFALGFIFFKNEDPQTIKKQITKKTIQNKRTLASVNNNYAIDKSADTNDLAENIKSKTIQVEPKPEIETSENNVEPEQQAVGNTNDLNLNEVSTPEEVKQQEALPQQALSEPTSNFINAPDSKTKEIFEFNEYATKQKIKLVWTPTANLKHFKVEITNNTRSHTHTFTTTNNELDVMIYPNENYSWRVLTVKKDTNLNSEFSNNFPVTAIAPEQGLQVAEQQEIFDDSPNTNLNVDDDILADTDEQTDFYASDDLELADPGEASEEFDDSKTQRQPASPYNPSLWSKFWLKGSTGLSVATYTQESTNVAELTHTSLRQPHLAGEFGFMLTDSIGFIGSLSYSPGRLIEDSNLFDKPYTWETHSAELTYLLGNSWKKSKNKSWYFRGGVSYQSVPLLAVFQTAGNVELVENTQLGASLGLGRKSKLSDKFSTDIYLNGQYPLSSTVSNYDYELDSGFTVQAYLGLKYRFRKKFDLGAYWQSKLLLSDFTLSDDFDTNTGSQFILNNNLGFYLGFDY